MKKITTSWSGVDKENNCTNRTEPGIVGRYGTLLILAYKLEIRYLFLLELVMLGIKERAYIEQYLIRLSREFRFLQEETAQMNLSGRDKTDTT